MVRKLNFIDIRKEIELLKERTSFSWVALRSVDLTKRCSKCQQRTPQYSEAEEFCMGCLGTGHRYVDKLVKGLKRSPSPGVDFATEVGIINTKTATYFFEHDVNPKNSDFVLELDKDLLTDIPKQPFSIIRIYKINDAHALLGLDRRIEYWSCQVEERNFDIR